MIESNELLGYLQKLQASYYGTIVTAEDTMHRLVDLRDSMQLPVGPTIAALSATMDECLAKLQLCGRAMELCEINMEDEELMFILEVLNGQVPLAVVPRVLH